MHTTARHYRGIQHAIITRQCVVSRFGIVRPPYAPCNPPHNTTANTFNFSPYSSFNLVFIFRVGQTMLLLGFSLSAGELWVSLAIALSSPSNYKSWLKPKRNM